MVLILGIGSGLFIVILLWTFSILLCLISSKLKPPFSFIGPGVLTATVLITAILISIPRKSNLDHDDAASQAEEDDDANSREFDWIAYLVLPIYLLGGIIVFGCSCFLTLKLHFVDLETT